MIVGCGRSTGHGSDLECAFRQRLGSRPLQSPPQQAGETRIYAPSLPVGATPGRTSWPGGSTDIGPAAQPRSLRGFDEEIVVIVAGRPHTYCFMRPDHRPRQPP